VKHNPLAERADYSKGMRLFRSFRHAFAGAAFLLRTQPNARLHLLAAIVVIAISAWLGPTAIEWALIAFGITAVWAAEAFNTAIEVLCDRVTTDHDPQIKIVKDVSAAAVLGVAAGAAVVGLLIFVPKFLASVGA
jgi:diacylglycerol kinase